MGLCEPTEKAHCNVMRHYNLQGKAGGGECGIKVWVFAMISLSRDSSPQSCHLPLVPEIHRSKQS